MSWSGSASVGRVCEPDLAPDPPGKRRAFTAEGTAQTGTSREGDLGRAEAEGGRIANVGGVSSVKEALAGVSRMRREVKSQLCHWGKLVFEGAFVSSRVSRW